jgi:poly(hydroxyalkanoate) depolymerase family esterase
MNALPKIDMSEVTRLTREGRLKDAMALLLGKALTAAETTASPLEGEGVPASMPLLHLPETLRGVLNKFGGAFPGSGLPLARRGAVFVPPPGARFEARSHQGAAGRLGYKLYVPGSHAGAQVPLVVMLHGCSQSPDDFAAGTRMNELAEEQEFLVVYPGQTEAANMSRCWNWFKAGDQRRDQGEPAMIAGITREIVAEFAVDPARVYVAGLSAGGAAAAIMAAEYPDLYAAVGVHSGLAHGCASDMASAFAAMNSGGCAPAKGARRFVPTIVFHGDEDRTVHPANADHVIAQSRSAETFDSAVASGQAPGGVAFTRRVETNPQGQAVLEQWVLHGAGHAWSGGSPAGSFTDPRGPDASREMLRFFNQHVGTHS